MRRNVKTVTEYSDDCVRHLNENDTEERHVRALSPQLNNFANGIQIADRSAVATRSFDRLAKNKTRNPSTDCFLIRRHVQPVLVSRIVDIAISSIIHTRASRNSRNLRHTSPPPPFICRSRRAMTFTHTDNRGSFSSKG